MRLLRARLQQVGDIDEAAASESLETPAHSSSYDGHDYTRREEQEDDISSSHSIERGEIEGVVDVDGGALEEARVLPTDASPEAVPPTEEQMPEFGPDDIPDISDFVSSSSSSDNFDRAMEERALPVPPPPPPSSSHDEDDLISHSASSYSVIDDEDIEDQEQQTSLDDALIDRTVRDIRRIRRAHHVRPLLHPPAAPAATAVVYTPRS